MRASASAKESVILSCRANVYMDHAWSDRNHQLPMDLKEQLHDDAATEMPQETEMPTFI